MSLVATTWSSSAPRAAGRAGGARGEQLVHVHPAGLVEGDADEAPGRAAAPATRNFESLDRLLLVHRPAPVAPAQTPWLTELMLKSGTRSAGIAARVN